MSRIRTAVLISGRGSNLAVLLAAAAHQDFPADIVLAIADRPAPGLRRAQRHGVRTLLRPRRDCRDRAAYDAVLLKDLDAARIDLVCLAGFMTVLGPDFIAARRGRILNIHPSLLYAYRGLDTHRRALAAGETHVGCSVHGVDEGVDSGPVLAQARLAVRNDDTPDSLDRRVRRLEHRLYPAALKTVADDLQRALQRAKASSPSSPSSSPSTSLRP